VLESKWNTIYALEALLKKVIFYFHDVKTLVTQGDSISKIEYLLLFVALTPLRGLEGNYERRIP
jgi:hypothetical protein